MRTIIIAALVCLLAMPSAAKKQPAVVILTAGQSNTAGRADNLTLPKYIKQVGRTNHLTYQYCQWSYTNSENRRADSEGVFRPFWPESEGGKMTFAYDAITYYYVEKALQRPFYVVKHALGGTSIDPRCYSFGHRHWSAKPEFIDSTASANRGGYSLLKAFCDNIGASIDQLEKLPEGYDIKCMLWHQGESDRHERGAAAYHDNLKAVVEYVRTYLVKKTGQKRYAHLPFICGTVPQESRQYSQTVHDALYQLATEDPDFHVIETSPGTFIGDDLHFDRRCAERLGKAMYDEMAALKLVPQVKADGKDAH